MSWYFEPSKTEIETEDGHPPLAVQGGGLFFPPDSPTIATLREHYRLINPEYKVASGMHKRGKYIAMPPKFIEACKEIPYDHPWGGGLAVRLLYGAALGADVVLHLAKQSGLRRLVP